MTAPTTEPMTDTAQALTIAGRTFRPAEQPTYRHRLYMRKLVFAAGLHQAAPGDGPGALAENILARVTAAGCEPDLLAAWLVEDGAVWSEASARANAMLFGAVTDPEEMDRLDRAVLPLLFGFFAGKASWPPTSPSSSAVASTDVPADTKISEATPDPTTAPA